MKFYEYINNKEQLAQNIQYHRKKSKLSQRQIAKKLKIDRSTYAYYELGKTSPTIFTLIKLAKIFHINLMKLISNEKHSENNQKNTP